ncbi:chemotaxis protein CheA [Paenibacillus sp. UNC499MF]|uniref:chemotaxis protein CheA n=1 Tax=Paenibacillus sp. UNC499MF TaxID=1502751 RepID=UPI0008A044F0|nr:chemotaxis protein CheA [Paenibacillus sp. UNC499MF]SEF58479.1 two-component system, chemotaxis family, sensor kinase CheA [Paenibacillus sp. UNC499MF]
MELNQYLSMFIDESKEHLQALNDNMLSLENSPDNIDIVHNIFRSAHTLKGMSATMGFEDLASLTHEMENVLDLVRNLKLKMDPFIFDSLFQSLDALESMVEDIVQGGTGKADVTAIVAALKSIVSGDYLKTAPSAGGSAGAQGQEESVTALDQFQLSVLQQSIDASMQVFYIEVTVREDCVLKAARAYMVFEILERSGEVIKATPSVQEIEQEKFDRTFSVYYIANVGKADLEKEISNVSEIEHVQIIVLDRETLDEMTGSGAAQAEVKAGEAQAAAAAAPAPAARPAAAKEAGGAAKPAAAGGGAPVGTRTIRVDIERLDSLMNLFSELLIDRVRLEQLAGEIKRNELTETVEHMARVSGDLQNIVLKLRMVPVDTVFNRFPRMIRDIAKSLDKKVDLVITGAETELDRTVIDEIGDPLVHLLRNAVDHGLETVTQRVQKGKSESGTVHLRAYHSGNNVFIEIEDNGNGINREKVLATAVKKGIVAPEMADKMSNSDIDQLLFASGFSTADVISDISGRGVGLDVVKTKIHSLGGHIHVESNPGSGSIFSIKLPLTLSIISAMLVKIGSEKYAIPLSSIVETALIQQTQIRSVQGNRMIDFRGSMIPLVSLSSVLDIPDFSEADETETEVVVVRKGEKMAALMVEEFIGQQEIVLKTLGKYFTKLFAISGATILGDGQVALILDTNELIK